MSTMTGQEQNSGWKKWLLVLLVLGIGARCFRYFLQFPIWGDESFIALNILDKDYVQLTQGLRFTQVSPILFLWIEKTAFLLLGGSELALRLFPLLAGIGALFVFCSLARRFDDKRATVLAIGLLAVSYFPLRHACEVKPYSFDLLFSTGFLTLGWAWISQPSKTRYLWGLVIYAPIAILSSFPSAFVAGAVSLTMLPTVWKARSTKVWILFLAFHLLLGVSFIGHFLAIGVEQHRAMGGDINGDWAKWFAPLHIWKLPLFLIRSHSGDLMAYPIGGGEYRSIFTFLLCILGAVSLWRSGQKRLLALVTLPFLMTLIGSMMKKYPYGGHARVAQHLAPSICILLAYGIIFSIHSLFSVEATRRKCVKAWLTICLLIVVGQLTRDIVRPHKSKGSLRCRVMAREATRKAQGEPIVVLTPRSLTYPVIEWYLRHDGQPVIWSDAEELKKLKAPSRFYTVQFSTNTRARARLPEQISVQSSQFRKTDSQEWALKLGPLPKAIQIGELIEWESLDRNRASLRSRK